jgi:GntR family transcriptional regulator, transcriptional repressor for pyruvate dehydrogenase complex
MTASVKPEFDAIRRTKIYEEVARQIERLVLEKLHPGEKLPSERELTQRFGVSRSSVRDAIRSLELAGLVKPRQGTGTVVREISGDLLFNPLANVLMHKRQLVSELLDVRKMLEPHLAARAATQACAEEITQMEEILRRQDEKMHLGKLAIGEEIEFHYAIARASDNSIILKVLDVLMDLLRDLRERSLQVKGRQQKSLAGHRRLLAAIKRHDAAAAETAMHRHIQEIENIVLKEI